MVVRSIALHELTPKGFDGVHEIAIHKIVETGTLAEGNPTEGDRQGRKDGRVDGTKTRDDAEDELIQREGKALK